MTGAIQPARFLTHSGEARPGVRRVVKVNQPAVGNDWSVTVPGGVLWYVNWGVATLTTSAVVANRVQSLAINSDGTQVYKMTSTANLVASSSDVINFASGGAFTLFGGAATTSFFPLPDAPIGPGGQLSSVTTALDVGDQWSAIALWIEEYYFTNQQLSELERAREQVEEYLLEQEIAQSQPGVRR